MPSLRAGEAITASAVVNAAPADVYAVVADVTRIPEWSPECVRCEWTDATQFRGWNRRRFGMWSTRAHIEVADPGREFSFVVRMLGRDFTRWKYRIEASDGVTWLIEEFQMCMDLPWYALAFERLLLGVKDRRVDLQGNLDHSLRRLRRIIEGDARAPRSTTTRES